MDKISVLIVDDSEADRYILKRDIKEAGFDAEIFEQPDGEEALDFFREYQSNRSRYSEDYPPMIVFLDINMPKVDGHTFLAEFSELREKVDVKSSVFMMFSTSEREEDKTKALSYSFVKDYLVKGSFTTALLKEKIESLVKDHKLAL